MRVPKQVTRSGAAKETAPRNQVATRIEAGRCADLGRSRPSIRLRQVLLLVRE